MVMEQPRPEGKEDVMRWYCMSEECKDQGTIVFEKRFVCKDLGTQVKEVVEEFGADEKKRTCGKCGAVAAVRFAEGQVVQPSRFPE